MAMAEFFFNFYFLHLKDVEWYIEHVYVRCSCEKGFFPVQQRSSTCRVHPCADELYGEIHGASMRCTSAAASQILISSPFTFLFRCAFLRSVSPCCTNKAMSSADGIVRLLNDGGVDSGTLAEVMTEYFCDDNDDAG